MEKSLKITACFLVMLFLALPLAFLGAAEEIPAVLMTQTVDFCELPISEKAFYQKKCELDPNSELFTSGILCDDASKIGVGENMTNFRGFLTRDMNGDSKTDTLYAVSHNSKGMRFTLGQTVSDWSGAEVMLIHIDNSLNEWSAFQSCAFSLNTESGVISLLPAEKTQATAYFYSEKDQTLLSFIIAESGYAMIPGNQAGWLLFPLSAFETSVGKGVQSVSFDLSSKAGIYTGIGTMGFGTDMTAVLHYLVGGEPLEIRTEQVGNGSYTVQYGGSDVSFATAGQKLSITAKADIGWELGSVIVSDQVTGETIPVERLEFTMPSHPVTVKVCFDSCEGDAFPERIYKPATDFSVVTVGDYRDGAPNWDCIVDTSSALYTTGVIVPREPNGVGEETTNFHGFWAMDQNGDGVTDFLRAHPYDQGGIRFTMGLQAGTAADQALLIRMETMETSGSSWNENTVQQCRLTLFDKDGNPHEMNSEAIAQISYFNRADLSVTTFDPAESKFSVIPVKQSGWLMIPLSLFTDLTGTEIFTGLAFSLSSTWNAYTDFYEVGFTSDIKECQKLLTGTVERYRVTVENAENGMVDVNIPLSREGREVNIIATPKKGYILSALFAEEAESGKNVPITGTFFKMPAADTVVRAVFSKSPYADATRLEQVYTVTQDFSTAEKTEYIDWVDGPDLTPLVEQGILTDELTRGFKDAGVQNSFNGNGVYVSDDGSGFGTSLRLWSHDNAGMSISLKSNPITDSKHYEGLVLHLHMTEHRNENMPGLSVVVYLRGEDGKPDFTNPITAKPVASLYGTTVTLVDDETGEVQARALGYSPEQDVMLDNNAKHYSQFLIPDAFTGYVLIPFSYFSKGFSVQNVAAVRLNYTLSTWYMYSTLYDIGFTPSIENFTRIASLGNYNDVQLSEEISAIPAQIFEQYKGTEKSLKFGVLKNYIVSYMWSMSGLDILKKLDFDPTVTFCNIKDSGYEQLKKTGLDGVVFTTSQKELPGKCNLLLDVSWDFFDGTHVILFRFDPKTQAVTKMGLQYVVENGYVSIPLSEGGSYVIALEIFQKDENDKDTATDKDTLPLYDDVIDSYTTEEKSGHYETIPGTKRFKTQRITKFDGFAAWFIATVIVVCVVIAAAIAVTVILLMKRKRRKQL